jgi:hypothetical protein
MKRTYFIICSLLIVIAIQNAHQAMGQELPKLNVAPNQRYLMTENGDPFFWLGDTGWLLFSKLDRAEADQYLSHRAQNGFNVIQVMLLHQTRRRKRVWRFGSGTERYFETTNHRGLRYFRFRNV